MPKKKKKGQVFHAGFMTYLLIAVIIYIGVSAVSPETGNFIVDSLGKLFGAILGE